MVTVVWRAVTDISFKQPICPPPPTSFAALHSPHCTPTTSFLSTKSCKHKWHEDKRHAHHVCFSVDSCLKLTSTAIKGQSPPCSKYCFLSKVVICSAPIRVHWPSHFSRVHCHSPVLHTLRDDGKIKKGHRIRKRSPKRDVLQMTKRRRHSICTIYRN